MLEYFVANANVTIRVNFFQILQCHYCLRNPALIGSQNEMPETRAKICDVFSCLRVKYKFFPVPHIGAGDFIIDHSIPVEEKGPSFIDLCKIE